jgi:hypothetical protein
VTIDSVEFINKFGLKSNQIKSKEPLKIKVYFTAKDNIKEPHFGIAIFRNDGVYCYGPNTEFDGYKIPEIKAGRGWFALDYHQILLAPGEYQVSVAIWDKNETLAFDYHNGCHKLIIQGPRNTNGLLRMPFKVYPKSFINFRRSDINVDLNTLIDKWGKRIETDQIIIESVKLLNYLNEEKEVFKTNEPVKLLINFSKLINYSKNAYLWVGLYRDDGVYCQGITQGLGKGKNFKIVFPKLPLLPGGYRISLGIWDSLSRRFLICHHAVYPFHMVFNRQDHGTIFLEHKWALSTKEMRIK